MNANFLRSSPAGGRLCKQLRTTGRLGATAGAACLAAASLLAQQPSSAPASTWPQPYTVQEDDGKGVLSLATPFYTVEHDLRRGGAITRICLKYGRASNLLAGPVAARVLTKDGVALSDLPDTAPKVTHRGNGLNELVTVECRLLDGQGRPSGLAVRTTFEYRWGYVRVHREFLGPAGFGVRELCPFSTVLTSSLSCYGYREGIGEEEGAPPFAFGSNRWGRLRPGHPEDAPLHLRYVPRSMIFVDSGVEGLEWFVSSDLAPWEAPFGGGRGRGQCRLQTSQDPSGLALSVAPLCSTNPASLPGTCAFDFYLAVPLAEGHARRPWLHTSFNRNHGNWVAPEQVRRWAEEGIQTVHCHNDGDYYDDGLFWRDGSYPPYPDMEHYDQVLQECHRAGIRTATYFSNKELHPSTLAFREHGDAWGRKDRAGHLQHNFFRGTSEFGVQMCLRSGWLDYLKSSIDRVLKHHPLDGVYYDWNVALYCCNPRHEAKGQTNAVAAGHWDIDQLLDLMEWTRQRVGPKGLVIVHNTTTPMFATENFADDVVATEWGYRKWTDRAPDPADLPLEWSLAGARTRGVISYGTIDSNAPRRLHRLFAIEAFLGGVTPWPAGADTFDLAARLKPLGDFASYRFADWRNEAVTLSDRRCGAAVYSRPDEAWLFIANLEAAPREVTCVLHPEKLPDSLARPSAATLMATGAKPSDAGAPPAGTELDVGRLVGEGLKLNVPGEDAILIRIR